MKACQICLSVFEDNVRFCPFHGSELKNLPAQQFNVGDSICDFYLKKLVGHDGLGNIYCASRGDISYRFRLFSHPVLCSPERVKKLHEILEKEPVSGGGIPITDFDWLEDGTLFSVHPYIPGRTFRDLLGLNLKLSENEVAELLYQLLRSVKDIHAQGIICGNISLSNIILDNGGRVRIHDAGLWDLFRDEHFEDLRNDNPVIFDDIIDLMSPEIARGEKPAFQSDVYSCGAAACCLLCGKTESGSAEERMKRHVNSIMPDFNKEFAVPVSEDFKELLMASMIGSSGVRFQTPRAFITALLCTHEEIDESADSLSPQLAEKLLSGAEKPVPHNSFASIPSVEAVPLSINDIRSTQTVTAHNNEISEDNNLEKASWDTLASLVGENLEDNPIDALDHTNAVSASLDAGNETSSDISTSQFSVSSPFDNLISDLDYNNKLDDSANDKNNSAHDDFFSSLLSTPELSNSLDLSSSVDFVAEQTKPDKHVIDSNSPNLEQNNNIHDNSDKHQSDEIGDVKKSDEIGVDKKSDEIGDDKKSDENSDDKKSDENSDDKKQPEKTNDAVENKTETNEDDKDVASSKPHKRIGRKNKSSEDPAQDAAKEKKSKRKQPRRTSFAPMNEVEEADLVILPMNNPADKPAYAPIPWMTVSSGYKSPEINSDTTGEQITAELEAPEFNENNDFFENEKHSTKVSHKKRNLLALIIILLVLFLSVLIATYFVKSKRENKQLITNTQTQQNEDIWKSKIEQFYKDLAGNTKESREKALTGFRDMRNGNLDSTRQKECKKALIQTFRSQAENLKKSLKKSDEIADPLNNYDKLTSFDIAYNDCVFKIDSTLPDAENQKLACEKNRENGKLQVRRASLQNAQRLVPELKKQLSGWNEVTGIYENLSELARGMNIPQLNQERYESAQQKTKYENRLKTIQTESNDVAGTILVPPPVIPENSQPNPSLSDQVPAQEQVQLNSETPQNQLNNQQLNIAQGVDSQFPSQPQTQINTQPQAQAVNTQPQAQAVNTQPQAQAVNTQPQAQAVNTQPQAQAVNTQPQAQAVNTQPQAKTTNNETKQNTQNLNTAKDTDASTIAKTTQTNDTVIQNSKKTETAINNVPTKSKGNVPTAKLLADASQALAKKDLNTAASLCNQAVKQEPKNARAWLMFASVSEKQGKLALAATQAEKSCKISPKASCYIQLGNFQSKAGMEDEANQSYSKALELDPTNPQAKAKVAAMH